MGEVAKVTTSKKDETKARIIDAIHESNGLLTLAAKRVGLSRKTVWEYSKQYPEVQEAVFDAKERMLDFAESKLWQKIQEGDNTILIFFLKTQGKARGYVERSEITGREGEALIPQVIVQSDKGKKLTEDVIKGKGT